MQHKIILHGAGGHAKVVIDCLLAQGHKIVAVYDKSKNGLIYGIPVIAGYDPNFEKDAAAIISIGDNRVRQTIAESISHSFSNAIHPSAVISRFARFGVGCMILHGALMQADAVIGNHVIINTGAQVDHDGNIGDYVHIAPGAILCGNVAVGEGTLIGAGAVVLPGTKIGKWVIIGAGAVVTKNVEDFSVVAGVPGRVKG